MASVEHLAGRLLFIGFEGRSLDDAPYVIEHARAGRIGGVLLLKRNCKSREQMKNLCAEIHNLSSPHPLRIAIDQEGGMVSRLPWSQTPSPRSVARSMSPEKAETLYEEMAFELHALGVDWNLAPVVDLDIDPLSPAIGVFGRSFSDDAETATSYARALVRAHRRRGVATCLKHFPGHGGASVDTHEGLADITSTWKKTELEPYATLIRDGELDAVMTGHLLDGHVDSRWPATLSHAHLRRLRVELGWDGLVVSDDIQMGALRYLGAPEKLTLRAVQVGVDVVITGNWLTKDPTFASRWRETAQRVIDSGELAVERLEDAAHRLRATFS